MLQNLDKLKESPKPRKGGCMGIGIFFVILGIGIMGLVYWIHTQQQAFASIATSTMGTVVQLEERTSSSSNGKRSTVYAPVVQFVTKNESLYVFTSAMASNPPAYRVEDQVEVLYNAEDPTQAVLAQDNSITTNPFMMVLAGLGAVLTAIGVGIAIWRGRQRQMAAYYRE